LSSISVVFSKKFSLIKPVFGGLNMQRESVYDKMTRPEKEVANLLKQMGITMVL